MRVNEAWAIISIVIYFVIADCFAVVVHLVCSVLSFPTIHTDNIHVGARGRAMERE